MQHDLPVAGRHACCHDMTRPALRCRPHASPAGLPCEAASSTCNGGNELCHGRGPAWPHDRESALIIGKRQFEAARKLFESAGEVGHPEEGCRDASLPHGRAWLAEAGHPHAACIHPCYTALSPWPAMLPSRLAAGSPQGAAVACCVARHAAVPMRMRMPVLPWPWRNHVGSCDIIIGVHP